MFPRLLAALLAIHCGGCASVTYVNPGVEPAAQVTLEEFHDAYLLGFISPKRPIVIDDACRDTKLAKMEELNSAEDIMLGLITFGIYTPRTLRIWCEARQ